MLKCLASALFRNINARWNGNNAAPSRHRFHSLGQHMPHINLSKLLRYSSTRRLSQTARQNRVFQLDGEDCIVTSLCCPSSCLCWAAADVCLTDSSIRVFSFPCSFSSFCYTTKNTKAVLDSNSSSAKNLPIIAYFTKCDSAWSFSLRTRRMFTVLEATN